MTTANCICGHPSMAHEKYHYKDDPRPCHFAKCSCRAFEHANRKWKYSKSINAFAHPMGVVRTLQQLQAENERRGIANDA